MFLAALLMSAAPVALAPAPRPVFTIIIDQREHCGIGRIAEFYKARADREARETKARLKAEGKDVRIVRLMPGMEIGRFKGAKIMNPAC